MLLHRKSAEDSVVQVLRCDDAHDRSVALLALLPVYGSERIVGGWVEVAFMVIGADWHL